MMLLKQKILEHCKKQIADKLADRQQALQELIESAANETKSTAGDKYETGRAMLHIEQDNVRRQLADLKAQKAVLDLIDTEVAHKIIGTGSLVHTNAGLYFISIALGKIQADGTSAIALSAQSPLGTQFMRLSAGDSVSMNGNRISIQEVG